MRKKTGAQLQNLLAESKEMGKSNKRRERIEQTGHPEHARKKEH